MLLELSHSSNVAKQTQKIGMTDQAWFELNRTLEEQVTK
jgi:hypothetical protein